MSHLNRPTSKRRSGSPELMYLLVVLAAGFVTAWRPAHQIGMDLSSITSRTTTGLAVLSSATSSVSFTDGWRHWAITPGGDAQWEGTASQPPGGG